MEKRDLYDEKRNITGETILKGEKIPEGKYIVVVLIFIQNSEGKFLIQKRSDKKNGKFATTGGHPKSGESSIEGILTEVKEEIGQDVESLEFISSYPYEKREMLMLGYKATVRKKDFKLSGEVDSVEWVKYENALSLLREGSIGWQLVKAVIER